jgi:Rrf2 family protein
VAARTVAEKEEIPEKFLEGILLGLKNARVISSERGREDGYRLRKPPNEIFIGDVVRLIDGPLTPLSDVAKLQQRVKTESRHPNLFDLFLEVRNAASAIVDRISLADFVECDRWVLVSRGAGEPGW